MCGMEKSLPFSITRHTLTCYTFPVTEVGSESGGFIMFFAQKIRNKTDSPVIKIDYFVYFPESVPVALTV